LLIGMMAVRTSSVTACSETARLTPSSSPQRAISGTTPEVERVIRRLEMAMPSPSIIRRTALATLS
jgi:hypothetical protein